MNKEEYQEELENIINSHNDEIRSHKMKFAKANRKANIGDIISDHCCTIKVDKELVYLSEEPYMVYLGIALKKDLTPRKDGKRDSVHECNMK